MKRDIFISYKNDGEGRYFAEKLSNTLKDMGFSVYYNTDEHYAGNFPNRLREAVERCTDFLLVLTQACLDQLKSYEKVDWVREEISIAKEQSLFVFLYKLQEEVHRFSVSKMDSAKRKTLRKFSIEQVDGIGKKKAQILMKHFKTLADLKNASVEEISRVKGISTKDAEKIFEFLNKD